MIGGLSASGPFLTEVRGLFFTSGVIVVLVVLDNAGLTLEITVLSVTGGTVVTDLAPVDIQLNASWAAIKQGSIIPTLST